MMKLATLFFWIVLAVMHGSIVYSIVAPLGAYAAGGGSMGGGSGGGTSSLPRKSPHQVAIDHYNAGIRHREKAEQLEIQLAAAETDKAARKLEKKINKEYKKAAKRFRSAVKKVSALYQAHASLGYVLKQLGEWDQSMAAYNEALRLRPEYTPAIEYRAEAYLALGNFDGVREAHLALQHFDPENRDVLELAIGDWIQANDKSESNADFYDWATTLKLVSASSSG